MPPGSNAIAPALNYPSAFAGGPDFYLSLATLAIGVAACVYFLIEWLRHQRHRFLLYWSFGFLAVYWFQIPTILANANVGFTLSDFSLFYAISFPLGFGGLVALYLGIRSAWPEGTPNKAAGRAIFVWELFAFLALWILIAQNSSVGTHLLISVVIGCFIFPALLLVLEGLWRWRGLLPQGTGLAARVGILVMAGAVLFWMVELALSLQKVLAYPADFWFVALSEFRLGFVLQASGSLLLLAGFLLVHHGFGARRFEGGGAAAAGRTPGPSRQAAQFVVAIVVSELAGGLGALFTAPSLATWYGSLNMPSFTPPGWAFSAVWTALFFLMGTAAFLVWRRGLAAPGVKAALLAFLVQLALNVGWSAVFFGAHLILAAFLEIIVLWAAILWAAVLFARVSRAAAWLLAPYLAWVAFAAYLNFAIWRLN